MKYIKNPLYLSGFLLILILILWFFPEKLNLLSEEYPVKQFRSDLKDLAGLFYIVVTLWLVLVTRKMAETSVNAQKAMNRPEILTELYVSDKKPIEGSFTAIKNIEIRSSSDAEYIDDQEGASVFLVVKNRYGGGKAINISLKAEFKAKNPENLKLERNLKIDFLAEGDAIAFYIYRYEKPSTDKCSLELTNCELKYTNPFSEASNEPFKSIDYNKDNAISANGNHIGLISLNTGIRITE
jgi:hypothetical protein